MLTKGPRRFHGLNWQGPAASIEINILFLEHYSWDLTSTPARCSSSSWTVSVLSAHELRLLPITTPAYSPESNGLAEVFAAPSCAMPETVLAQLGGWIEAYNRQALHSALGMRSPADYGASLELAPPSV